MSNTVFVNGIVLENELIGQLLDKLTKMFNGSKANRILEKLGNGDIDLSILLEDDIGSTKEIEQLRKELENHKRWTEEYKRKFQAANKDMQDFKNENWKLREENQEFLSAMRYYEDTLHGLKLRNEILNRKDLGKIFADPSEEEGWSID